METLSVGHSDVICLICENGDIYHFGEKVETPEQIIALLRDLLVNKLPDDVGSCLRALEKIAEACKR